MSDFVITHEGPRTVKVGGRPEGEWALEVPYEPEVFSIDFGVEVDNFQEMVGEEYTLSIQGNCVVFTISNPVVPGEVPNV